MKKPLGFIDKLRIFYYWMRQHEDCGLMTACGVCDSTLINRLEWNDDQEDGVSYYKAKYKCKGCGAVGYNSEKWLTV